MLVSNCCNSDIYVYTTGEGTSFYCCKMCEHGCDPVMMKQKHKSSSFDMADPTRQTSENNNQDDNNGDI